MSLGGLRGVIGLAMEPAVALPAPGAMAPVAKAASKSAGGAGAVSVPVGEDQVSIPVKKGMASAK